MTQILPNETASAFAALSQYDFGGPTDALSRLERIVRESHRQPRLSEPLRRELNRFLESDAPVQARQFACKSLWILGPNGATPALSKLLASPDTHLVEAACFAIGIAPSAEADRLLLEALDRGHSSGQLAIINLIGRRRIVRSVPPLSKLAGSADEAVADSALAALGMLGTPDAIGALTRLALNGSEKRRLATLTALLQGAQVLAAHGDLVPAGKVLASISSDAKQIRRGADHLRTEFARDANRMVPFFNGRDLSEWEIDTPGLWQVRNGVIIGRSPGLKYNDFLRTKKSYADFILSAKVRMIDGNGNSGIQFRSKPAAIPHEVEGYQADAGERYWGALYDESRRKTTLASPDETFLDRLDPTVWHTYLISAQGNHIRLQIDGVETANYEEREPGIPRSGIIALQVHAWPQPVEVWFRDLMIRVL